jgi:hypothetical protein
MFKISVIYDNTSQSEFSKVQCALDVISDFIREVDEILTLLGCYLACSGNSLPTFRDNISDPSSSVSNPKEPPWIS